MDERYGVAISLFYILPLIRSEELLDCFHVDLGEHLHAL